MIATSQPPRISSPVKNFPVRQAHPRRRVARASGQALAFVVPLMGVVSQEAIKQFQALINQGHFSLSLFLSFFPLFSCYSSFCLLLLQTPVDERCSSITSIPILRLNFVCVSLCVVEFVVQSELGTRPLQTNTSLSSLNTSRKQKLQDQLQFPNTLSNSEQNFTKSSYS